MEEFTSLFQEGLGLLPLPSSRLVVVCLNSRLPKLGRCFWLGQLERVPDTGSPGQHKPPSEEGNAQALQIDRCAACVLPGRGQAGSRQQPLRTGPRGQAALGSRVDCPSPQSLQLEAWRWRLGTLRAGWTLCCSSSGLGKPKVTGGRVPSSACSAGGGALPHAAGARLFSTVPSGGLQGGGSRVALAPGPHSAFARACWPVHVPGGRQQDGREGSISGGSQGPPASAPAAAPAVLGGLEAPTAR